MANQTTGSWLELSDADYALMLTAFSPHVPNQPVVPLTDSEFTKLLYRFLSAGAYRHAQQVAMEAARQNTTITFTTPTLTDAITGVKQ